MFTGIIEEIGTIRTLSEGRLVIAAHKVLQDTAVGDSIAVNGICLTFTPLDAAGFCVDVMPETMRRTSLALLKKGSHVNLERALTLSARLGGHIVSGHIDGTGTILSFIEEGNAILLKVAAEPARLRYILEKGSVALDGISLTVTEVTSADFTVSLIPHTRAVTILGERKAGDPINIETDVVGKYVERFLTIPQAESSKTSGITAAFLEQYGF